MYEKAEAELVYFDNSDVVTTSSRVTCNINVFSGDGARCDNNW